MNCTNVQIVKETIGVGVNEKQSCGFIKLPFRLHQFRFFLGEQSRVPFATIYGNSIFALFYKFIISRVLLTAGFAKRIIFRHDKQTPFAEVFEVFSCIF